MSLVFRWLGVAGVELRAGDQVLAIDPFFTRPSLLQMLKPLQVDEHLALEKLPACDYLLVTHPHYDHLMDVAVIVRHSGAMVFGSANSCQLLRLLGVPPGQVGEVHQGDVLSLGAFKVEVIAGQHSPIPMGHIFTGNLRRGMEPPLRVTDFRMDTCLGYRVTAAGIRLLVCAREPLPADILLAVAQEPKAYYVNLFQDAAPGTFIPIHWDNFTRPLRKPLRRFSRPGRMPLWQVTHLARQCLPHVQVIIPEIFKEYIFR